MLAVRMPILLTLCLQRYPRRCYFNYLEILMDCLHPGEAEECDWLKSRYLLLPFAGVLDSLANSPIPGRPWLSYGVGALSPVRPYWPHPSLNGVTASAGAVSVRATDKLKSVAGRRFGFYNAAARWFNFTATSDEQTRTGSAALSLSFARYKPRFRQNLISLFGLVKHECLYLHSRKVGTLGGELIEHIAPVCATFLNLFAEDLHVFITKH